MTHVACAVTCMYTKKQRKTPTQTHKHSHLVCIRPNFLQHRWLCPRHKRLWVGNVPIVEISIHKCRLTLYVGEVELGVVEACIRCGGDVVVGQEGSVNEGETQEDKDHGAEPWQDITVDGGQHLW